MDKEIIDDARQSMEQARDLYPRTSRTARQQDYAAWVDARNRLEYWNARAYAARVMLTTEVWMQLEESVGWNTTNGGSPIRK